MPKTKFYNKKSNLHKRSNLNKSIKNKKQHEGNNKTLKNTSKPKQSTHKAVKHCYNDEEVITVCKTGRFTKTSDEGLYNPQNIEKFDKMTEQLNRFKKYKKLKIPQLEYTKFLMDTFEKHNNNKKESELIKHDFYGYVNDSWLKKRNWKLKILQNFMFSLIHLDSYKKKSTMN